MREVISNLQHLDAQLGSIRLDQFILFNKAYRVVTHSIQASIQDDYFQHPKFIEAFIIKFAGYYFAAVNDTATGNPDVSPPWAKLNDYATHPSSPVFISLMLGANAHINNDLSQVLEQLMPQENPAALLADIIKIDRLLMKSGKQIIDEFEEKNKVLNFLKNRLQFMYYRPAMYTILYWRVTAWKNYEKLKKDNAAMVPITRRSIKIANRLLYISKALR